MKLAALLKKTRMLAVMFMLAAILAVTPQSAQAAAKISRKTVTLAAGKTVRLSVKGTKKKVKWSSSKKSVAKVNKNGKVTALKEGKAVITAKVGKKRLKCKVTVTASRKKVYAKYRKAIKKLDWPTAVFAAVDIDGNGINEVIVEDIVPNGTDFHPERKGVIIYYKNGLKQYQYGPGLDTFEAVNSKKQLVFGRTRGKAITSIYSFSRAKGVKSVTSFFAPYLSEDEAAQMEATYLSGLKYPKFYPASSANLKTYLGGKGKTTGTSGSYTDKGLSNI